MSLRWRHNDHAGVSNHQPHGCLLNRLYRRTSKKTSKLRVTGLCAGNSPGTGEFPAQMASYAENVSIWWRHHGWPRPMSLYCVIWPQWVDRWAHVCKHSSSAFGKTLNCISFATWQPLKSITSLTSKADPTICKYNHVSLKHTWSLLGVAWRTAAA